MLKILAVLLLCAAACGSSSCPDQGVPTASEDLSEAGDAATDMAVSVDLLTPGPCVFLGDGTFMETVSYHQGDFTATATGAIVVQGRRVTRPFPLLDDQLHCDSHTVDEHTCQALCCRASADSPVLTYQPGPTVVSSSGTCATRNGAVWVVDGVSISP